MKGLVAAAVWLSLAAAAWAASPSAKPGEGPTEAQRQDIQRRYEKALKLYTDGGYSQAIAEWTAILELSPAQQTAETMIRQARAKIDARDRKEQDRLFAQARDGRFQKALVELQALLARDATHPLYKTLGERLQRVTEIVATAPGTKPWRKAAIGLSGYVARVDDLTLAYNGLRYARELDPGEKRFARLLELVLAADPTLTKDAIPDGAGILKYKRDLALNRIQDGRYLEAVVLLDQVLALEPSDLTSLKRQGSAYFMLKRYPRAEAAWTRALQIAPNDAQLKKFLSRLQKQTQR